MIRALSFSGYSDSQVILKQKGLQLVNIALSDPDFEAAWLKESCTETNGMTQMQVLDKLRENQDIEFRAYRSRWSKVIGYFISGDVLWDNLKYIDQYDDVMSGSNDGHEVLHVKGFSHYGAWATSVPYTFNRVFEKWAYAYLAAKASQPVAVEPVCPVG